MTDEEIARAFGYDFNAIRQSEKYQADLKDHGSAFSRLLSDPKEKRPVRDSLAGDVYFGAVENLRGAHQFAVHLLNKVGIRSDADAQYIDLWNKVFNADWDQNIRHGNASTVGRIAGAMVVPGAAAAKSGTVAARIARAAAAGAAGAGQQPVVNGGPNDFWTEKAKQAATGAVAGPVGGAVATGVGKLAGKTINAVKNNIPAEAAALIEAARRRGIRLTYGDITGKPGVQRMEQRLEEVPGVGMPGLRKDQHDAARGEANRVLGDLESTYKGMSPADIADVEAAAKAGDDYARRLLDQIRNAGDDADRIIQASIGLQNFRTRAKAEDLYKRVEYLVTTSGLGNDDVPANGIRDTVQWALNDAQAAVIPNKKLVTLLKEIQANIQGVNTFGRLRRFRSDISDIIREHRANNNAIIGEKGVGHLERIRGAIEGDLQDFVDQSGVPQIQAAAREADEFYKRVRVPFKDAQLTSAASSTEPDQILQKFLMPGKGDRAQKLYNALDPKAQAAVRYEMARRAIEKATNSSKGIFSPTEYDGYFNHLKEAYGVFFKGKDKWEMDGLRNIMAHIPRAGQFMENPPTGNRVVGLLTNVGAPVGAAIGAVAAPGPTAAGAGLYVGIAGLSRFLLTTEAGKRFLLAAGSYKPGSPQMQKLLEEIAAQIPAASGKAAGQQ
jgi:hypothetical protein